MANITNITKSAVGPIISKSTTCLTQGPKLKIPNQENRPKGSHPRFFCRSPDSSFNSWMLLWMDSEWSLRVIQHIPAKSSHPCPWANNKESIIAALFCSIVWHTESTSANNPVKTLLIASLSFTSQQPSLLCSRHVRYQQGQLRNSLHDSRI